MAKNELPPELAGIDPMSMVNKHIKIQLPTIECPAQAIVKLVGQQAPSEGDDMVADGWLFLPAMQDNAKLLIPALRFDRRIIIGGFALNSGWGQHTTVGCYRTLSVGRSIALSWLEAAEKAGRELLEQLAPLILHLKAREERMNSPGKELYLAGLLEDHANARQT